MVHEDVFAEALDERASAVGSDLIGDDGAEVAADGSKGCDHGERAEAAGIYEVSGERHDDFRRERDAGGFDAHENGDAGIAERRDDGLDESGEYEKNLFDQLKTPSASPG